MHKLHIQGIHSMNIYNSFSKYLLNSYIIVFFPLKQGHLILILLFQECGSL